MQTEKPSEATAPAAAPSGARSLDQLICYFEGSYVPLAEAKVSIMTHTFMYGTATFEGIRAYWNAEQETLLGLFVREHVERIRQSARILVTHEMGFARAVANRMFFFDEGLIVESGTPDEIFKEPREDRTKLFLSQVLSH